MLKATLESRVGLLLSVDKQALPPCVRFFRQYRLPRFVSTSKRGLTEGDRFRRRLPIRRIPQIIPPRWSRKVLQHPEYHRYGEQNCVERPFGKLKENWRIANRHDKTAL